jgi:hypothetical protein
MLKYRSPVDLNTRIVVPPERCDLKEEIMSKLHDIPTSGHPGTSIYDQAGLAIHHTAIETMLSLSGIANNAELREEDLFITGWTIIFWSRSTVQIEWSGPSYHYIPLCSKY